MEEREKLEEIFQNFPDMEKTLRASYRSATVLIVGFVLPMVFASGACYANSPPSKPVVALLVVGCITWAFPMVYVLSELKAWSEVLDRIMAPACFRQPVTRGIVVMIAPEKVCSPADTTRLPATDQLAEPLAARFDNI